MAKILIVDDEVGIRELLSEILRDAYDRQLEGVTDKAALLAAVPPATEDRSVP